ncbi:MAG: DegT/DnrJ/EryC1/StrS family aminotransferase [Phycisphaerales bacterium]|nr:MAG: DegT/DnrJ/EryC1/StrS family aminotransferase [Phycisphaerales bacterium]
MHKVGMLDLKAEYELIRDDVQAVVETVLESQQHINGPAVAEFETEMADRLGVKHAIAVSSGTDSLLCSMMALDIGYVDEVILPSFTFFATAGSVARLGATPVFVDIDSATFNIDPASIEQAITERTRAIIVVHLFGQCADMDVIRDLATHNGLALIEDAAQAIGATYRGQQIGSWGDTACLSFYPTKNLGGFGEGGMILANDEDLAALVRQLRNHGESERYIHQRVGGNFRLDTMKAAILRVKLQNLDEFTRRRRHNAALYNKLLDDSVVTAPYVPEHHEPVYHQYSLLCDRRDDLQEFLQRHGIATGVYYAVPLHLQKCFASLAYKPGALPVTEQTCANILSLPCHPMLADNDIHYVVSRIHEFYGITKPGDRGSGKAIEKTAKT